MTTSYLLKVPKPPARNTFYLLRVERDDLGRRSYTPHKTILLDAINVSLKKGAVTLEQANKLATDLRQRLNREAKGKPGGIVFNQENLAFLGSFESPAPGSYWKEVYSRKKRLVDRRSSYYDLRRAVEAVGNLSLLTATEDELQARVDGGGFSDNAQRRIIARLMPLLKFIGRTDIKLEKARPEQREVRYLTLSEFAQVVELLPTKPLQLLCKIALHSGLRQGEIFALQPGQVSEKHWIVQVNGQMDIMGRIRPTKTRAVRKAAIIPGIEGVFEEWFALPPEERLKLRQAPLARILKQACGEAFPTNPAKHCVFHDLRHSYAVYLLGKGIEMAPIAQCLGNSVLVCEMHYTGKVLTTDSLESIKSRLGGGLLNELKNS